MSININFSMRHYKFQGYPNKKPTSRGTGGGSAKNSYALYRYMTIISNFLHSMRTLPE